MQYSDQTSPHDSPMGNPPGSHGAFHLRQVGDGWAHIKPVRADLPLNRTRAIRVWVPTAMSGIHIPVVTVSPRRSLHRGRVGLAMWSRPFGGGLDHWLVATWACGGDPPPPVQVVQAVKAFEPRPWDIIHVGDCDLVAGVPDQRLTFMNMQISLPVRERLDLMLGLPLVTQLFRPRRVPWALRHIAPHMFQLWVGL